MAGREKLTEEQVAEKKAIFRKWNSAVTRPVFVQTRDRFKRTRRCSVLEAFRLADKAVSAWVLAGKPERFDFDKAADAPVVQTVEEEPTASGVPAAGLPDVWLRLVAAAGDKRCTKATDREWVASVLLKDPEDIDPTTVPSAAAVGLLQWARANRSEFYKDVYARAARSESAASAGDGLTDDGQSVEDIIKQFIALRSEGAVLPPGSEGVEGERSVADRLDSDGVAVGSSGESAADDV